MIYKELKKISTTKIYSGSDKFKSMFIYKDGNKSYSTNRVYEGRVVKPELFALPRWTDDGNYEDRIIVKEFEMVAIMYDMIIYKEI